MHLTMSRPAPYTVPSPLHALQRQTAAAAGYGVAFSGDPCNSAAAASYTPTPYNNSVYQGNSYGSSYSSLSSGSSPAESSYVAQSSRSLCSPGSPSDTTAFSPSSSNGAASPTHSPQLNGDCNGQSPLKSCCQYSPASSMHPMGCTSFFPHSSQVASSNSSPDHSLASTPINGYTHSSYGLYPSTTSSMYPLPDYHPQYSSSLGFSNNPTFSSMALWNYQPVNQYPKVSYDTPRYKLTPERALPLIKWFEDHKDHPYPSRCEKMLLCQSTMLTFTQVSTWFANARRRMKKAALEEEEEDGEDSSEESCSSDKDTNSQAH